MSHFSITFLCSGSEGNCAVVTAGETRIVIDAGLTAKEFLSASGLTKEELKTVRGVLLTHGHTDHARESKPLFEELHLRIYCTRQTLESHPRLGEQADEIRIIDPGEQFWIGDIRVKAIAVPHCVGAIGFFIEHQDRSLAFFTDLGSWTPGIQDAARRANSLCLEADYSPKMLVARRDYSDDVKARIASDTGHLSNNDCMEFLSSISNDGPIPLEKVCLLHLSVRANLEFLARAYAESGLRKLNDKRKIEGKPAVEVFVANESSCPLTLEV